MSFIFDAINWKLKIMKKWLCKICFLWENKNRTVVIFLLVGLFVSLGFVYVLLVRNKRLNKENRLLQRQYEAVDNALFRMEEMQKTYLQYENMKKIDDIDLKTALFIGCFQCLSLIPGTSRSGSTILGAIILGVGRAAGAEFSFFLAIPTMLGASVLKLVKFLLSGVSATGAEWAILAVGCVVSFVVSLLVIKGLMEYVRKHSFAVFGVYRIILGVLVLGYFAFQTLHA